MKIKRLGRPSPAMVVAILALIAGLFGTAIAASPLTKKKVNKIITRRAPGLTVGTANKASNANNANNANALEGQGANAFQTASASDARHDVAAPQGTVSPALSATISTSAPRKLTAVASVTVSADGGGNDNINCRITIDGVDGGGSAGGNQSTYVTPNGLDNRTTLPLTLALTVGAGTHTVLVECGDGIGSNTSLQERYLTVVATA